LSGEARSGNCKIVILARVASQNRISAAHGEREETLPGDVTGHDLSGDRDARAIAR
jgi:hypothetical protein